MLRSNNNNPMGRILELTRTLTKSFRDHTEVFA